MEKRGQVTTFMIIGFVIVIIVVVLFFFKNSIYESILGEQATRKILNDKMEAIDRNIKNCFDEEANSALKIFGSQGGTFNPINYKSYKEDKINYLCYQIPNSKQCENHMLTETQIKRELYEYLYERVYSCVDVNSFSTNNQYTVQEGDFDFGININDNNILFNITYPITLERKGVKVSNSDFNVRVDVPLGSIQKAVKDILEYESNVGTFNPVSYTLLKQNEYVIYVLKPYPDTIYQIKQKDSDYIFQFAIKGINEHK